MSDNVDYDLIVIGAGGAGLAGAIWAAEAGCKVIILEAEDRIGGSTALSDGVFNAADTSLQRKLGFTDSIDEYYDYYMTLNAWRQPAALIRTFCDEATPTLEWLIGLGVKYPEFVAKKPKQTIVSGSVDGGGLYAAGVEWPPRGHCPAEGGSVYIDVMENRRAVLGVELVLNTRVQQLIVEDGAVGGVIVDGETLRSRAVLLACGGISQSTPEMIKTWFPDAYDALPPGYHPTGPASPGHRGDGVHMARQAGADIIGHNCGLAVGGAFLPYAPPIHHGNPPSSLIYVNAKGQRFAPETAPYAVMPGLVKHQGFNCWGVFDEAARKRSDSSGSGYAFGWDPQFILDCVERGDILQADTIEELAIKCGMRPGALRTTIEELNEDIVTGEDRWFLREIEALHPIAEGPFYAFQYRNTGFTVASVGPRIDRAAHALDEDGRIIPGFYAAGEAGAGVLGERYVGGGNAVANALTMGRVAGMTIGRELKGK
ncbi:MAG: FAD-dependent oxidoreductase [Sphingomonadales bacterium]|nr:FAD-dependent oxidoreductase [Sphingomonadales bacterium]MBU3992483.1 FAD-dependent oxidoreductase [Alphaproteobacteria bacterium]